MYEHIPRRELVGPWQWRLILDWRDRAEGLLPRETTFAHSRSFYQVRCNLFHGGKRPTDERDATLVTLSVKILREIIRSANLF
jgi:hypothetical protein